MCVLEIGGRWRGGSWENEDRRRRLFTVIKVYRSVPLWTHRRRLRERGRLTVDVGTSHDRKSPESLRRRGGGGHGDEVGRGTGVVGTESSDAQLDVVEARLPSSEVATKGLGPR